MNADAKPTVAAISYAKPTVYRHLHRIAWLDVALELGVILFGAFVRLSNACLSCPDWRSWYGRGACQPPGNQDCNNTAHPHSPMEVTQTAGDQRQTVRTARAGISPAER